MTKRIRQRSRECLRLPFHLRGSDDPEGRNHHDEQNRSAAYEDQAESARPTTLLAAIENGNHARCQLGAIRQRYQWPVRRVRYALGEQYQLICVGGRLCTSEHCVIAGTFGFKNQLPPCDPDQRMNQ